MDIHKKVDMKEIVQEAQRQILYDFNNTQHPYPFDNMVYELFEKQVDLTPDNIAIVQDDQQITYRELDQKANRIAHYLLNQYTLKGENIVAVLESQSIQMIISILGILKAGFAFLPMDPLLPEYTLKSMIDEAGSKVIISTKKHIRILNRLQWECESLKAFVCLDSKDIYHEKEEKENLLMNKNLWDYVGEGAEDPISRGGWKSSFTGELFTREEIIEYSNNIKTKLKPYINKNTRILEIGCASGFTMFELAPLVGFIYGTDLSDIILDKTRKQALEQGYTNIQLKALPAHDIDKLAENNFDIIILNSVIQAFHGHNYFRQVIEKAVHLLKEEGIIFVGDIMDQNLKNDLIKASVSFEENHVNSRFLTKTDFSDELFLSAEFFNDLVIEQKELKSCTISKKIHSIKNELTQYRFDAILEVDKKNIEIIKEIKTKEQHGLREIDKYPASRIANKAKSHNLAYVIFTSGSTGKPKGVMVEHRSLVNMCCWYNSYHMITSDDRSCALANCGFDASIMEVFPILLKGGSLYILSPEIKADLKKLNKYFEENKITICYLPTQYCEQFMELENKSLRIVNTGGEKLKKYIKRNYTLVDNYGPTECTVVSSYFAVNKPSGNIPIGKPIFNTRIYILDKYNRLLPPGEVGELCVSGDNVARGYLNNPGLTVEKFVEDPFFKGERMYRTGDLARWRGDGNIEFSGRIDSQVKIRGYRIEPGEIELKLIEHPNIKETIVTAYTNGNSEQSLCAYIVLNKNIPITKIKEYLGKMLPEYMIPHYFYILKSMPLTLNGKINKNALPTPGDYNYQVGNYAPPRSNIEMKLAEIWQEVLSVHNVGIHDNFFELGGHSLKVLKAATTIHKVFNTRLSAAEMFKVQTIKEQAELIEKCDKGNYSPIQCADKKAFYPASSSQKRIYAIQQMNTKNTAYNIPFVFSVKGKVSKEKLKSAFQKVVKKHEILRTTFDVVDGTVVQRVKDEADIHMEYKECVGCTKDKLLEGFIKPFDLNQGPLLRIQLVMLKNHEYSLLFDIHHIILDGSSMEILWDEFVRAYNGEDLGTLKVQYKDFTLWQIRELAEGRLKEQSKYWLKQFGGEIPVLRLPLDYERPETRQFEGDVYQFSISSKNTGKLKELSKRYDVSMNMLLLAAYNILLAKYSGQEDIIVGTPVYGRNHADLKNTMGMFANTLALRSYPQSSKKFEDYLKEIRHCVLNALDHQDYPFEELVEKVDINRDASRNPLFDAMFVMQKFGNDNLILSGLEVKKLNPKLSKAKFDMTWFATPNDVTVDFEVEYCTRLFTRDYIKILSMNYERIIDQIINNPLTLISDLEIIKHVENKILINNSKHIGDLNEDKTVQQTLESPADSIEKKLAKIFKEVLEIDNIGVKDDFFEMGGHSLKAIMLMHKVKKVFKRELSVSMILQYPTVKRLALYLKSKPDDTEWSHLVEVKKNDCQRRIFCIHPLPGTVVCYYDLAKHFNEEWSIYALQSKGLIKGQIPHDTLEEMAADYIKAIKDVQPEGPYILVGWCVGGRIGYEIAQQLYKNGESIDLLAMLDTDPEFLKKTNIITNTLSLSIYTLGAMLKDSKIVLKNFNITYSGLKTMYSRIKMWISLINAVIRYKPVPYQGNGKIVLFQTKEGEKIEKKIKNKSQSIRYFINGLEVVPTEGKHLAMLSEPNITNLYYHLKRYLEVTGE